MQSELRLTGIQTFISLVMKIILETDKMKIETKADMIHIHLLFHTYLKINCMSSV